MLIWFCIPLVAFSVGSQNVESSCDSDPRDGNGLTKALLRTDEQRESINSQHHRSAEPSVCGSAPDVNGLQWLIAQGKSAGMDDSELQDAWPQLPQVAAKRLIDMQTQVTDRWNGTSHYPGCMPTH